MTLTRKWMPSPNFSSRAGASVRILVVHTTEGARTIESLGSYFSNPGTQVSSHTGADDTPNTVGEYVRPVDKSWTVASFNPVAENIELCAFASWSRAEWLTHPTMLDNTAQWLIEEGKRYGIPMVRLTASQAQGNGRGICGHVDLGALGGSHHDPGNGFPWDVLMSKVDGQPPTPPSPPMSPVSQGEPAMATSLVWNGAQHVFTVGPDGLLRQRWQLAKGWGNAVIGSGKSVANQSPATDQHSSQLHVYAVMPDSKLYHAWQAKNGNTWSTEILT